MLDLFRLALAQQAVVHEHAGELVADRTVYESRGDGGIDTARQAADDLRVADPLADLLDLIVDDVRGVPVTADASTIMQEAFDERLAPRGVLDLWMPLHAVEFAQRVLHRGHWRTLGVCEHLEALGGFLDSHTVAHPCGLLRWRAGKDAVRIVDDRFGLTVFTQCGLVHITAEFMRHHLESIADAEHRHTGLEHLLVDGRGAGLEHRGGATGKNDRLWVLGEHLLDRHGMWYQLRIDVGLTHATGNQLRVLGAEINDEYRPLCHKLNPLIHRYVVACN